MWLVLRADGKTAGSRLAGLSPLSVAETAQPAIGRKFLPTRRLRMRQSKVTAAPLEPVVLVGRSRHYLNRKDRGSAEPGGRSLARIRTE